MHSIWVECLYGDHEKTDTDAKYHSISSEDQEVLNKDNEGTNCDCFGCSRRDDYAGFALDPDHANNMRIKQLQYKRIAAIDEAREKLKTCEEAVNKAEEAINKAVEARDQAVEARDQVVEELRAAEQRLK